MVEQRSAALVCGLNYHQDANCIIHVRGTQINDIIILQLHKYRADFHLQKVILGRAMELGIEKRVFCITILQ